jgi:uncharacterized protein YegJ (DUF2314 family)
MNWIRTPEGRWALAGVVLTSVLFGLAACGGGSDSKSEQATSDTTAVTLPPDDPSIANAQEEAQTGWNAFVASFRSGFGKPGVHHDVKVALATADGALEHLWVEVTSIEGETVKGTLNNDPVGDVGLKYGDEVTVKRTDVEDWAVFRKDKLLLGGFSIEAEPARDDAA